MPAPARALTGLAALPLVLATACSSSTPTAGSESIAISATDDACTVATTTLAAGKHTFRVTNDGTKTTEVYVYAAGDKIVGEVENVGPKTSRDLTVTLAGGSYEVACKPGQTGAGIRADLTVTGPAATSASSSAEAGYDREIEVEVTSEEIGGLEGLKATKGERVEFKLTNATKTRRELKLLAPDGSTVDEVEAQGGKDAEFVAELERTGTYTLVVEGGSKDVRADLIVS